jgi:hypothetical protein
MFALTPFLFYLYYNLMRDFYRQKVMPKKIWIHTCVHVYICVPKESGPKISRLRNKKKLCMYACGFVCFYVFQTSTRFMSFMSGIPVGPISGSHQYMNLHMLKNFAFEFMYNICLCVAFGVFHLFELSSHHECVKRWCLW